MAKNLDLELAKTQAKRRTKIFSIAAILIAAALIALPIAEMVTNYSLLFAGAETLPETFSSSAFTSAYVFAAIGAVLAIAGGILCLKGNYRTMQTLDSLAVLVLIYPLVYAAILIASSVFAIVYTALAAVLIALMVLVIICSHRVSPIRWVIYIKEMIGEVKKLSWLSLQDLAKHVGAVMVFVLAMALIMWVLDLGFSAGVQGISSLNPSNTAEPTATAVTQD